MWTQELMQLDHQVLNIEVKDRQKQLNSQKKEQMASRAKQFGTVRGSTNDIINY